MENMEELRTELRELTESAAVLLDDQLYTFESYRALVHAVAYAKVVLADESAEEEMLRGAHTGLCEAIDGMELREKKDVSDAKKQDAGKTDDSLRAALPYLLGGAALGGLLLGKKLFGKKKQKKPAKQQNS